MTRQKKHSKAIKRRTPCQERATEKVELIFEATLQLIEEHGLESLTTNTIAAKAGVSIGTLYQYFGDKQAILNGLIQKRIEKLSEEITEKLKGEAPLKLGGRVGVLMNAALNAYGGRQKAHRLLLVQALTRGEATRLNPFLHKLTLLFASGKVEIRGRPKISSSDGFVMVHAFLGVLRAVIASTDHPPVRDVEESLTRLFANFVRPAEGVM